MKLVTKLFLSASVFVSWIWIGHRIITWMVITNHLYYQSYFALASLSWPIVLCCFIVELPFVRLITKFDWNKTFCTTALLYGTSAMISTLIMLAVGMGAIAYHLYLGIFTLYGISILVNFCIELAILRFFVPTTKRVVVLLLCANISKALVTALVPFVALILLTLIYPAGIGEL